MMLCGMLPWRYNKQWREKRIISVISVEQNKVSKSEVVEKVILAGDFWTSADDMCQKL